MTSPQVVFVNTYERWTISILVIPPLLLAAVGAAGGALAGDVAFGMAYGGAVIVSSLVVAWLWRRGSLTVESREAVVRGAFRTMRIDLRDTTWSVVPTYVGLLPRASLAVALAEGGVRELGGQGIWSPRRGPRRIQLDNLAKHLNALAAAAEGDQGVPITPV